MIVGLVIGLLVGAPLGWTLCSLFERATGDQRRGGYIR